MSTLQRFSFEADSRQLMASAIKRGWAKVAPPPVVVVPPPPPKESVRRCRKQSSRVFWRVAGTLTEPFTIEDLSAAAGSAPKQMHIPRNWIAQRVLHGELLSVGDRDSGRKDWGGGRIMLASYRRCENFAELAEVALGDAP